MSRPADASLVVAQSASPTVESGFWNRRTITHLALVVLTGAIARIPFYLAFRPILSGDSDSYSGFYCLLVRYHVFIFGARTPVYPFFLGFAQWLVGVSPQAELGLLASYSATLLQSEVGLIAAGLFYCALRILRCGPAIALGAAIFFATIPAICLIEINILNMALSCSLLVLTAALFLLTMKRLESGKKIGAVSLTTGAALSLLVLNRPEFLIFAILLGMVMAVAIVRSWAAKAEYSCKSKAWGSLVLIALPVTIAVLAWMLLVYIGIGQFRITTFDKLNRSHTVYNMFDRVEPEDSVMGDIMSRTYRDQVARNTNANRRDVIWQALLELAAHYRQFPVRDTGTDPRFLDHAIIQQGRKVLGWVEVPCQVQRVEFCWEAMRRKIDLYDYVGRVSWKLARKYPADWLRNVTLNFFEESFDFRYSDEKPGLEGFQPKSGDGNGTTRTGAISELCGAAINKAIHAEAPVLMLLYCVTLGFFLCAPWILMRPPDQYWMRDMAVIALVVASVGTIVGTCVLAGLNRAYTLPHLVVFTIATAYVWEHRSRFFAGLHRAIQARRDKAVSSSG